MLRSLRENTMYLAVKTNNGQAKQKIIYCDNLIYCAAVSYHFCNWLENYISACSEWKNHNRQKRQVVGLRLVAPCALCAGLECSPASNSTRPGNGYPEGRPSHPDSFPQSLNEIIHHTHNYCN